jgi:hypothetical protein
MQSSPVSHHLRLLRCKCSPQHPVLKYSLCVPPLLWQTKAHTYNYSFACFSFYFHDLFLLIWPGCVMSTGYELCLSVFEQRNERQTADVARHLSVKSTLTVPPSASCSTSLIYPCFEVVETRRLWEDNIKMDLRVTDWEGEDWMNLTRHKEQWRAL